MRKKTKAKMKPKRIAKRKAKFTILGEDASSKTVRKLWIEALRTRQFPPNLSALQVLNALALIHGVTSAASVPGYEEAGLYANCYGLTERESPDAGYAQFGVPEEVMHWASLNSPSGRFLHPEDNIQTALCGEFNLASLFRDHAVLAELISKKADYIFDGGR